MTYNELLAEAQDIIKGYEKPSELSEIDLGMDYIPNNADDVAVAIESPKSIKDFAQELAGMF